MKQVICLWVGLLWHGAILAQQIAPSVTLPGLPLRFTNARRFDPVYVDSIVAVSRGHLARLDQLPRSHLTDTLRLSLLQYLAYCYRFATNGQDSVPVLAKRLIQTAQQQGNVRFQVAARMELHDYYHTTIQDFPEALRVNHEALRLAETNLAVADEYLWNIQSNLGQVNFRIGRYREAATLYRAAYASLVRNLNVARLERIRVLQLLSESYLYQNQLDSAEYFSKRALFLDHPPKTAHLSQAHLRRDLGEVYLRQKRYAEALEQFKMAEAHWHHVPKPYNLPSVWANMAKIHYLTGQYDSSFVYAQKAMAREKESPRTRLLIYEMMSLSSAARQDWRPAYLFHQQFKAIADSIQAQRKLSETMGLQAEYEREKLLLRQQQERQRYQALEQEKALQGQQFLTLARETELRQVRATAERQELLQLANQTELRRRLETQNLKTQAQTRQSQQESQIRILQLSSLQNRLRLQEQTRNSGLAMAGLLGVSLLGYTYLLRRKNQALRQKNGELQAAQHHGQTQEMAALRAQMNPHFLFNCINSIKLYTLQNDTTKASDYLTKFARLIRLVLENSRAERITLHNELEALRLYCELEAMRFKQKVSIVVRVAPNVDREYVQIPPLLLQPYVENAIWHGLMHKPAGGTVTIDVSQPTEQRLHIEITDDGIGRGRAAELKSKSAGKQKSFGMQVTADRIRMINQLYNIQTQTRIYDLVAPDGDALGTKVVVEIPV